MRVYYPALEAARPVTIPYVVTIHGEDLKYLKNVLRAAEGDEVVLFDGKGNLARTVVARVAAKEIALEVRELFRGESESPLRIKLLQGIPKGQKMDLIIQRTAELGVSEIQPVFTARTEVRDTRKLARWRKIASEAARQSGRTLVPVIPAPLPFEHCIKEHEGAGIIFWEEGGEPLKGLLERLRGEKSIAIAVGPEGGFTAAEVEFARKRGFYAASLGPRILRAETAAIAAMGILQYELGDSG